MNTVKRFNLVVINCPQLVWAKGWAPLLRTAELVELISSNEQYAHIKRNILNMDVVIDEIGTILHENR